LLLLPAALFVTAVARLGGGSNPPSNDTVDAVASPVRLSVGRSELLVAIVPTKLALSLQLLSAEGVFFSFLLALATTNANAVRTAHSSACERNGGGFVRVVGLLECFNSVREAW
jgi:hypothetical protein